MVSTRAFLMLPKMLECCVDKVQVSESYQGGKNVDSP